MNKKLVTRECLAIIDQEYVEKYGIDKGFIGKKIIYFSDRCKHIEKHKMDFTSERAFNYAFANIREIVSSPDFVTIDKTNNSLLFIKALIDTTLVAARVSISNDLKIRTMYPINETKKEKLLKQAKTKVNV